MKINEECLESFGPVRKGTQQVVFSIENGLSIFLIKERVPNSVEDWNNFIEALPQDKCCHVFTHFPYVSATDGTAREKFVHILWAPSEASGKEKMTLSFFAQQVLSDLGALGAARLEAGALADLEYESVKEKILRRVTVK